MIDTHCHLTDPRLGGQLQEVLNRAAAAGVERMITIGTGIADSRACIEVCRGCGNLRCSVGIHPNHAHEEDLSQIGSLRLLQAEKSVAAIGECGLDYHYGLEHKARQTEVFERQLRIATEFKRPVIVHCREALADCLAVMKNFPSVRAVYHCFTGTAAEADAVLNAGYWLGFTGVITFKKSDEQREAVRQTPDDRLLVETDAPYLSPEPHRKQKVNEPALVVHVADVVGQIKNLSRGQVDKLTTGNASRFFGWS